MKHNWKIKNKGNQDHVKTLSKDLVVDESLANLLVQRDVTTFDEARLFFRPKLSDLHDPFLMKDMEKAIDRLVESIANNEKILVYGDYDVDGTTSVALVYSFLKDRYDNIDYYIPDRYAEGYGVSFEGIQFAIKEKVKLIISLDCGIKAVEKVDFAKENGIDFIICDHHNPGDVIPRASAVLDPKRKDCEYPFKELSGCGVGYKFLQGYTIREGINNKELTKHLDLVCVSIASDIVPIVGENRNLAYHGLKRLSSKPRIGLRSIIEISGNEGKDITIADIVFKIGPRINAAGRIETGHKAVELLIATEEKNAHDVAHTINDFNTTRKDLDHTITNEALTMIETTPKYHNCYSTVLYQPHWHKGVIGIVASRLIENYYRPTVIMTKSNGFATGSARSVNGFNLYEAVESCSDLLENFGGHMYAAGLTMKIESIPEFSSRFEDFVRKNILPEQLTPQIDVDSIIKFADITQKFFRILRQFAPFGPENMSPVFVSENVYDVGTSKIVGATGEHLKLDLIQNGVVFSGIAFRMVHLFNIVKSGAPFKVCYSIEENEFRGNISLQLRVKDIKALDAPFDL